MSRAGQRKGLLGDKSALFYEFVRALNEVKPKWFLFENVASMRVEDENKISELLGCTPFLINSKWFSAQERPRLYWTNIPIGEYKNVRTVLKDIMQNMVPQKYYYNFPLTNIDMSKKVCATMEYKTIEMNKRVYNPDFKCATLTACGGGNTQKKVLDNGEARKLTPLEYERLQTLPDNYTQGLSDTRRYTCIGNGWLM